MGEAPLIGAKLGNYRLERELGRGRMGVVYLAIDEALLRPTAIKVLAWSMEAPPGQDPQAWFLAEARSVARVNHPAVVQIYGVARHGPHCYIAMEYVEGVSADRVVEEQGPFAADRATEIVAQVAGALQLAHDAGIVHRDVKPANLLVAHDGTAKLGDFGMALHLAGPAATGVQRAGTPHYIAPEVWRGDPASPASDIYALGATYFFLLTGRPPFEASDIETVAAGHLRGEIRAAHELRQGVPPRCSDVIRRCMAKLPGERYASAQELQWELRGILRAMEIPARSVAAAAVDGARPVARRALYDGEPLATVRRQLKERLAGGAGAVLLTGAAGSGRTTLARQVLADSPGAGPRAYVGDVDAGSSGRTVVQRAARAFGALPGASSELDGLLDVLRAALAGGRDPALLVLDGLGASRPLVEELDVLARVAASTGYLRVLLVGPPELGRALAGAIAEPPVVVPGFTAGQARGYLEAWLRAEGAAPAMITPDAALLAGWRAHGNLKRMNHIAANMLRLAEQRGGSRMMTSWEAWIAPLEESASLEGERFDRPAGWPTEEALHVLNDLRAEAGAQERR